MEMKVTLTQFDPNTMRYIAQLTVTESDAPVLTYTCEGTWRDGTEAMIAGSLYDQYKRYINEKQRKDAECAQIESKIMDEVAKQATLTMEDK